MSCHRKLENSETLPAEPMKKIFRFSWVYKDGSSFYINASEAKPMDFTWNVLLHKSLPFPLSF